VDHHLLTGVEIARLADEFTFDVGLLPGIDLFAPVETAQEPVFFLPGFGSAADARTVVVAPYVVDQIRFSDKVQLLAGARYDDLDFEDDVTGESRSDGELSPMLGVVVSPTPELQLYANAGQSFAPPSTLVVGQERVPEESSQVELGLRRSFLGGKLQGNLAFFQLERENIAIPDDTGVTQQTGDQRSRGVELELHGQLRPRLRVFLAYAYTDAELTEFREQVQVSLFPPAFFTLDRSGNTPAFAPEHLLSLWVSQRFTNGLGLALGGRWVSEQFIAEDNVFEIDAYTTVDAAIFYGFGPWELSLHLENLTDEEYLTRGFGSGSVIPAPGFRARSGFSYTF
jgi:outer membrane receptor protein involved in Fe transport